MMDDLISRQAAIDALNGKFTITGRENAETIRNYIYGVDKRLRELPSAETELPFEIQDILDYLDTVLHPIISPEYWNVYSELYDMISTLPPAEPFSQKEKLKMRVKSENLFPDLPQNIKDKNTEIAKAYQEGYEQGKKDAERRGQWIAVENDIDYYPFMCSECYETVIKMTNYCPRCGARCEE